MLVSDPSRGQMPVYVEVGSSMKRHMGIHTYTGTCECVYLLWCLMYGSVASILREASLCLHSVPKEPGVHSVGGGRVA